jgi:Predicted membrane protein (DUF2142)
MRRLQVWRLPAWLLAFLAFFLLAAGWSLAEPYNSVTDEAEHVYRAVGVAYGEVVGESRPADQGGGAYQTVPKSLIRGSCVAFKYWQRADCQPEPGGDATLVNRASQAGRYQPTYYLVVGWPLRIWPNWAGIIGARLISAALVAAFLAIAAHSALTWFSSRLVAAGLLIAVTPMALHLSGSVNPNAVEIAAGVALFATLAPMLLGRNTQIRPAMVHAAGAAAMALATVRTLGPLFVFVTLASLLMFNRGRLNELRRSRIAVGWLALIGVGSAANILWVLVMRTQQAQVVNVSWHYNNWSEVLRVLVLYRVDQWIHEMVGIFGYLDTPLPGAIYAVWCGLFGLMVGLAAVLGDWTTKLRLCSIALCTFGMPIVVEIRIANTYGLPTQGRYLLPIAVGMPIVAGVCLSNLRLFQPGQTTKLLRALAVALIPVHPFALAYLMIRWQVGLMPYPRPSEIDPLNGHWHPPLGSVAPLVASMAGCAVLMYLFAWVGPQATTASGLVSDSMTWEPHSPTRELQGAKAGSTGISS